MGIYIDFLICFIIGFICSFSATPLVRKLAFKWNAVSIPKDDRRMHTKAMPLMGGLAMVFGFTFSVLFTVVALRIDLFGAAGIFKNPAQFISFFTGMIMIVGIGIIDDIKVIPAKIMLPVQLAVAAIVTVSGMRIMTVTNPFAENGISTLPTAVSYIVTILWIVGITNAMNFIDGLDGLATGVSAISSVSLFVVSLLLGRWEVAILTAALAGATLGFLPFNFNPAKIFMGGTGSIFLGYTLAVISIPGDIKSITAIAVAVPLLVFGVPIFDVIYAIIRRIAAKRSPMSADREHLHHKLIDLGLSQKQSVLIMYILSALLGLCAILLADRGAMSAIILVVAVAIFIAAGAKFMWDMSRGTGTEGEEEVAEGAASGAAGGPAEGGGDSTAGAQTAETPEQAAGKKE